MPKDVACQIVCKCGGIVDRLDDGIYYILTEDKQITFRGYCNRCHQLVRVTKAILAMYLMAPGNDTVN